MERSRKYYKKLSLIRLISCIEILLYHMGLLKGGYLAVCTFFVLSGYLSCISCFNKEKFSLKKYYATKLKHIYLPLVIVTFLSIAIISLIPNINWFNLKPETTSVLLGYNNFWQLGANLDYFARHVNSPFMHFWYMGIMLQFDLVFPYIYIIFRKLGDKISKILPPIIMSLLAIILSVYFYNASLETDIMITYYNTFTRIFSLFFGVALGFIHSYYGSIVTIFIRRKFISKIIFYIYLLIMCVLFATISADSKYFAISMIVTSFITCRLIDYGIIIGKKKLSIIDKIIKYLSNISYEIYLVQYPIIFLLQNINLDVYIKNTIIVVLVLITSCVLHFAYNFKGKLKALRVIIFIPILVISLYGTYQYIIAEDHTQEMKELEEKLAQNEKIMQEKQKEYANQLKQEQDEWMDTLENLENGEKELINVVSNASVVGVGDSVMLGAIDNLYAKFPNGYFDAKVSRTAWVANGILKQLKENGMLGDNIVMNLGANGDCPSWCKLEIMNTIGDRKVFWLNTNNDDAINKTLSNFAKNHDNLYVVDWKSISNNHPEYFVADKIHLTEVGKKVFTETIYNAIYNVYLEEYNNKKQEIINSYEEKLKNKLSFIGNDILLNAYDYLKDDFEKADFIINSKFNYESLKNEIEKRKNEDTLSHRIVFMFDEKISLNQNDYKSLIELCIEHELYILDSNQSLSFDYPNVKAINFYQQIVNDESYLMPDKIHLTDVGNRALNDILKENLNT